MKQKLTEPLGETDHCQLRGQNHRQLRTRGQSRQEWTCPALSAAWPNGHPDAHSSQGSGSTHHDGPSCHHKMRLNKFKGIVFSDHSKIKLESTSKRYQENPSILFIKRCSSRTIWRPPALLGPLVPTVGPSYPCFSFCSKGALGEGAAGN